MNPLIFVIPESASETGRTDDRDRARENRVLRQLDAKIEGVSRPRLVLDCSRLRTIGIQDIHLLVECLERTMKRNGDVRLSGVSPDGLECLAQAGADRLFRIYATREDAARSFGSQLNVLTPNDGHAMEIPPACSVEEAAASARPLQWVGVRESGETNESTEGSQGSRA